MILRHVLVDDLEILFQQQCEVAAHRMAGFPPRAREAFMTHWKTNVLANPSGQTRIIEVQGAVAGYVTSWASGARRFVAYWLGQSFWGRGLATRALTRFVLEDDVARPLHATVAPANVGSVRVLEKCGFTRVTDDRERVSILGDEGADEVVLVLR